MIVLVIYVSYYICESGLFFLAAGLIWQKVIELRQVSVPLLFSCLKNKCETKSGLELSESDRNMVKASCLSWC